ncbi:MAG: ferritin [Kiritimatiellia bacterium]|nr:ferritin [Kiritimatiellia bacterium]
MLNKKMAAALNEQMNREFYSAYLYLSMSAYSAYIGLKGAANWFYVQYQEEMVHFDKLYHYVLDQGEKVELKVVKGPPNEFKSLMDMFEQTLKHERYITQSIHDLVDFAIKEKDHATEVFLQWYVTEQVEEEANDNDVLARLRLAGKDGNGLFMVDKELATRVFVPPATTPKAAAAN